MIFLFSFRITVFFARSHVEDYAKTTTVEICLFVIFASHAWACLAARLDASKSMKTGSMNLPFLRVGGRFSAHSHPEGCAEKLASKPVSGEFKELQVHVTDHILKGFLSLQTLCFCNHLVLVIRGCPG